MEWLKASVFVPVGPWLVHASSEDHPVSDSIIKLMAENVLKFANSCRLYFWRRFACVRGAHGVH